jgi:hypothetical protein
VVEEPPVQSVSAFAAPQWTGDGEVRPVEEVAVVRGGEEQPAVVEPFTSAT